VRFHNGGSGIEVKIGKNKQRGKARRFVPMTSNLKAWLKPHAKESGPVWAWSEPQFHVRVRELIPLAEAALQKKLPKASLERKDNAMRHSFITYRVADVKDVNQVALESGNSSTIIFSNYRAVKTEQDARRWFAIKPK